MLFAVSLFAATLGFTSGSANADVVSVNGDATTYNSIDASGNVSFAGAVYTLSPAQGVMDGLFGFNLSAYAGEISGAGTLTLSEQQLCCASLPYATSLSTTLSVYALTSAFTPGTAPSIGSLLDTQAINVTGTFSPTPVSFTIDQSVLASWAASPASNYGFMVTEGAAYTADVAHSDIVFYGPSPFVNAANGPVLSFDVPEPASMAILAFGLAGIASRRRSRCGAA